MFAVLDFWVEGVRIQCGVPEVGLSDQPGHEALVPVLGTVMGPWEVVGGQRCPAQSGTWRFSGVWISSPPTSNSVQYVLSWAGISSSGCQIS